MKDQTEQPRRSRIVELNAGNPTLIDLEQRHGRLYTTEDLQRDFTVTGFLAPFVEVVRKSDDVRGTMEFIHSPRVYFNFQEA